MPRDAVARSGPVPPSPGTVPNAAAPRLSLPLAVVVAVFGVSAALAVLVLPGLPGALLTWPLAVSLWQLSVTPFCRATGIYRYHSPMLKATIRTPRTYEVHGGTSWDWLALLSWSDRGVPATRKVLAWTLEGLLDVAEQVDRGEIPRSVEVTGTSYFFSAATARRLGFEVRPAGARLRLNLLLNAVDLTLMYSFTRGRPALPDLLGVRQAVIRGGALAAQAPRVRELLEGLRRADRPTRSALRCTPPSGGPSG